MAPDAPVLDHGAFTVTGAPGLGVCPDLSAIEEFEVTEIAGAYLDPARLGWFPTKPAY